MPIDGKTIIKRYETLYQNASTHFALCEQMAKYIAPSRVGMLGKRSPGQSQMQGVFDSTSLSSASLLAQFISSYTMNPAQQWGSNRMRNPAFRDEDELNEWLEESRDRQLGMYDDSMFYAESPEALIDCTGFGTSFLLAEEMPFGVARVRKNGFRGNRFEAVKTGRFVIADGPDGLADTAGREHEVAADVMARRWGMAAMPENVRKVLQTPGGADKPFCIVHMIYPRSYSDREFAAGNKKMPWASCWVEKESKALVYESGYRVFPGSVARYQRTPGEAMGRGVGHTAFADIWSLNELKRMSLEDFSFKVRPPVLVAHDSVFGTLRLVPGAATTIQTHGLPIESRIRPWETGSRPEITSMKEEELRKSIRQIFFVDQILALMEVNKSEMTAFEFAKKLELLFRLLGPVYGRIKREFMQQVWDQGFDLCYHSGLFSTPPDSIYETDGQIETVFENPIEKAQRSTDVESIGLAVQDLLPLGQIFPQIWDRYDPDEITTIVNRARGVPAKATRSRQQTDQFRAARQQQEQSEQMLAQAGQIAEAGKNVAPLLTALQGGRQG